MAVKEQRQLSLFGTKISFSTSPEEEDRVELAKSSEDVNAEEFSSLSASTSGSDDEKPGALPVSNNHNHNHNHSKDDDHHGSTEVLPMTNGIGERRSGRGTLKRPDKPVPCPRCNSLDTKFCYFNNYNVNQPRHFCKNCQRYWTAGGTLRNVPVGAGRRKNKNSRNGGGGGENLKAAAGAASAAAAGGGEAAGHHHLLDSDKKSTRSSSGGPGTRKTVEASLVTPSLSPCSKEAARSLSGTSEASSNDSRDDSTCGSSVSNPGSHQSQERDGRNAQQFAWPPGAMLTSASGGNVCNSTTNGGGGFWQGFVWPAHPVWCPAGWNTAWNSQWGNLAVTAASAAAKAIAENVGSLQSALGKHLREEAENRGPLWAPKTMRIDAQGGGEGCRSGSSFLADIGAGNKVETISTGGMFKAFQQQESSPPAAAAAANKSSEEGDDGGGGPSEQELDNKEEFEEGEKQAGG